MAIPFWKSKTVWLNALTLIVMVLALFAPGSQFADLLSPQITTWLSVAAAVINIVLRVFFTEAPVSNPLR